MDDKRQLLKHFLATLAYRTQKAVRGAPDNYAGFMAGEGVRSPQEIVRHITGCILWARTAFIGGKVDLPELPTFGEEIARFHHTLELLGKDFDNGTEQEGTTLERLLQGPLSDAMTHAGQLAMLRRLCGAAVPGENFRQADIDAANLGPDQAEGK